MSVLIQSVRSRGAEILTTTYREVTVYERFLRSVVDDAQLRTPDPLFAQGKVSGGTLSLTFEKAVGRGSQLAAFARIKASVGRGGGVVPGGLDFSIAGQSPDGVALDNAVTTFLTAMEAEYLVFFGVSTEGRFIAQPALVQYDAATPITLTIDFASAMGDDVTIVADLIGPGHPEFNRYLQNLPGGAPLAPVINEEWEEFDLGLPGDGNPILLTD